MALPCCPVSESRKEGVGRESSAKQNSIRYVTARGVNVWKACDSSLSLNGPCITGQCGVVVVGVGVGVERVRKTWR